MIGINNHIVNRISLHYGPILFTFSNISMRATLGLPIYALKSDFLNRLSTHNMIVEAEKGSRESTRLPV